MNAYELAEHFKNDLLPHERHANHAETMYWVDQYRTFGKRAEAMLRKQADRIAELEKELETQKDETAMWKMSYENNKRFEGGYGHN